MPLKRIVFYVLAMFFFTNLNAQQQTADFGLFGGGAIPFSDYSKTQLSKSLGLNYGAFYRYNFNTRYSLRINALYGSVKASGFLDDLNTEVSFQKNVFDLGAFFEINYLDFFMGEELMNFSPYIFYGIGMSIYPGKVTANIPIGTGIKYSFAKKWAVGAEVSTRKLLSDDLDDMDNPYQLLNLPKVSDWMHNNDWINYVGITISYKFYWGKTPCPAYGRIND